MPPDEKRLIRPQAVLPRLVNAHTHLEFSSLPFPIEPALPFTDWIQAVIRHRRSSGTSEESVRTAITHGFRQSTSTGSGLLGEITTSVTGTAAIEAAARGGHTSVVSFREVLGFDPDQHGSQLAIAEEHLRRSTDNSRVQYGLSPHAPYSVHPRLFADTIDLAAQHGCLVAMHLAETRDELELLERGSGRFVDLLSALNLWNDNILSRGTSVLDYLRPLSRLPRVLAVHGNYLSDDDIHFLSRNPHVAVVYCPRTHAYFQHEPHPWLKLRTAGATVVLGTDSCASSPDLNIWQELRHVARLPKSLPLPDLLALITTTAAEAMGFSASKFTVCEGVPGATVFPCATTSLSDVSATLLRAEVPAAIL